MQQRHRESFLCMTFITCSDLFLLSVSKWLGSEVHYHLAEKGRKGENWRQRLFSGRAKNDTHFFSVTSCATKHRFHRLLDDKIIFLLSQITNTTNIFFFSAAFCLLGISFSRREKKRKMNFHNNWLACHREDGDPNICDVDVQEDRFAPSSSKPSRAGKIFVKYLKANTKISQNS